ncbi:MAG: hypothetical protein ACM34I_02580 [bacterium]
MARRLITSAGLLFFGLAVFLFVAFRYLHFSTNSAVLYVIKDDSRIRLDTDISFSEVDSLLFRVDATPLFNRLFEKIASATDAPLLNVSFDESRGRGVIKEFRPDGTRLEIALSRYDHEEASPAGIVIGGEFPIGDSAMVREGGGMAYFNGEKWIHLWCTANEGIALAGGGTVYEPQKWNYASGRIIKGTFNEVILESEHTVSPGGEPLHITRRLDLKAGDNFATLMIRITNTGKRAISYDYAYGDEPWIGIFGSSEGEVGWTRDGLITHETFINPLKYSLIGYADVGNKEAGENDRYSGYANFIQWIDTVPSQVYVSNTFYEVGNRILDSRDNRVLNVVWKNQFLPPGTSKTYKLRIGFVRPGEDRFEVARGLEAAASSQTQETLKGRSESRASKRFSASSGS